MQIEELKKIVEQDIPWEKLRGKTLLISGGTGLIGRNLIQVLEYRNRIFHDSIHVISLSRRGGSSNKYIQYMKQDVCKPIQIYRKLDYIIHLASNTHPQQYKEDPIGTIMTNILGCANLLELAVQKKARFFLASSVEIYGQGIIKPMKESDCGIINCNQARSGYNESKRTSEALLQSYRKQKGVDGVIGRFARVFGVDFKQDSKVMAELLHEAAQEKDIHLKSEGSQRFSFIYVPDAVCALLKILLEGEDGEAYNISAEDEGKTLKEYAELMASIHQKK